MSGKVFELPPAIELGTPPIPQSVENTRRGLLVGLGTLLAAAPAVRAEAQSPAKRASPGRRGGGRYRLENAATVTAGRLDAEVAKAFALFNKPVVLPDFDAKTHGARNDVQLYRIVTDTTIPETGETIEVTGLLALPAGAKGKLPLACWQHGTILSFDQVPSNLTKLADPGYGLTDEGDSLETLFNVHRFAAQGFAIVAADYVGKGPLRNGRGEGYIVKGVTTATCLSLLSAARAALRSLGVQPTKLFLHGWSQGALNTQWLHQTLRTMGTPIAATAVASPFNDLNEAWAYWMGRRKFDLPPGTQSYPEMPAWIGLCMIIALQSHERYHGLAGLTAAAVRPEHIAFATQYGIDYKLDAANLKSVPTSANLLVDGFLDRFTDERTSAFLRHLSEGRTSYWHYDSPIRFCYGLADEAVHPAMVLHPLSAGGRRAEGVPVADGSHRGTFLAGLYGDASSLDGNSNHLEWFKSLL